MLRPRRLAPPLRDWRRAGEDRGYDRTGSRGEREPILGQPTLSQPILSRFGTKEDTALFLRGVGRGDRARRRAALHRRGPRPERDRVLLAYQLDVHAGAGDAGGGGAGGEPGPLSGGCWCPVEPHYAVRGAGIYECVVAVCAADPGADRGGGG